MNIAKLFVSTLFAFVSATTYANVITLNNSNLHICQSQIHGANKAIVDFYYDGCPYQTDFWPKYQKAASDPDYSNAEFFKFGVKTLGDGKTKPTAQFVEQCLGKNWVNVGSPTTIVFNSGSEHTYLQGDVGQKTLYAFLEKNI